MGGISRLRGAQGLGAAVKERDAWLAEFADARALHSYIAQVREKEHTEKNRAHFGSLRDALDAWKRTYEETTGGHESLVRDKDGLVCISNDVLEACENDEVQRAFAEKTTQVLRNLIPWRKGPFAIFNTTINAEWRSNLKWQRLARIFDIDLLCKNKAVLDIGANNLYYTFRMLSAGARFALAVDPMPKYAYYHQFFSMALPSLPLYFEMLGAPLNACFDHMFDSVFCMGILYHQRNPLQCLQSLHRALKKNGLIVIETICLNTHQDLCLFPQKTYQNSSGYWFIPSASVVRHWLTRCNFEVLAYDEPVRTSAEEQGSSDWLTTHTLENFLSTDNADKTVEGYDAPFRCIVVARKR